jgi:hypothetical protein
MEIEFLITKIVNNTLIIEDPAPVKCYYPFFALIDERLMHTGRSCTQCQRRKIKCLQTYSSRCRACQRYERECIFLISERGHYKGPNGRQTFSKPIGQQILSKEPNVKDEPFEEPNVKEEPFEEPNVKDEPFEEPNVKDEPFEEPNVKEEPFEGPNVKEGPFEGQMSKTSLSREPSTKKESPSSICLGPGFHSHLLGCWNYQLLVTNSLNRDLTLCCQHTHQLEWAVATENVLNEVVFHHDGSVVISPRLHSLLLGCSSYQLLFTSSLNTD